MASPFSVAAEALHTCLCEQVAAMPVATRPEYCLLLVGQDQEFTASLNQDRCRCGTAYVRIAAVVPVEVFPEAQQAWRPCAPNQWMVNLELGIIRCPPLGTDTTLPTEVEELAFTRLVMDDADAMRRAVVCCFAPSLPKGRQFVVGAWQAVGPQGMCGGGVMSVQVQVTCSVDCTP